jgi:hypothetical protein
LYFCTKKRELCPGVPFWQQWKHSSLLPEYRHDALSASCRILQ